MRAAAAALTATTLVGAALFVASPAEAAPKPSTIKVASKAAQAKVLKKVKGTVLGITASKRDGFTSWAVKVKRADGSIVVGYVDAKSGIIFDWTVQEGPGKPIIDLDGPDAVLEPAKPPTPIAVAAPEPLAATIESTGSLIGTSSAGGAATHSAPVAVTPVVAEAPRLRDGSGSADSTPDTGAHLDGATSGHAETHTSTGGTSESPHAESGSTDASHTDSAPTSSSSGDSHRESSSGGHSESSSSHSDHDDD